MVLVQVKEFLSSSILSLITFVDYTHPNKILTSEHH